MKTDARLVANQYRKPDETLLWFGQPKFPTGTVISAALWLLIFFAIVLCSFKGPEHYHVISLLLGLIVVTEVRTTVTASVQKARRTVYAVTDKRIFMAIDGNPDSIVSFRSIDLNDLSITHESPNGSGNLAFTRVTKGSRTLEVSFRDIPNVREVERLIRRTFAVDPVAS